MSIRSVGMSFMVDRSVGSCLLVIGITDGFLQSRLPLDVPFSCSPTMPRLCDEPTAKWVMSWWPSKRSSCLPSVRLAVYTSYQLPRKHCRSFSYWPCTFHLKLVQRGYWQFLRKYSKPLSLFKLLNNVWISCIDIRLNDDSKYIMIYL